MIVCLDKKGKHSHYTGHTNNLRRRFKEHEDGKGRGARYTRGRIIFLAYYESFKTRTEAVRREIAIKKLSFKAKVALIQKKELIQT